MPNKGPDQRADHVATVETDISASPAQVWSALTDPEQIKKFMFGTDVQTDWQQGSSIVWKGVYEGKEYEDKGQILEIDQGALAEGHSLQPAQRPAGRPGELPHARLRAGGPWQYDAPHAESGQQRQRGGGRALPRHVGRCCSTASRKRSNAADRPLRHWLLSLLQTHQSYEDRYAPVGPSTEC